MNVAGLPVIHVFKEKDGVGVGTQGGVRTGKQLNTWQVVLGTIIVKQIGWEAMVRNCWQAKISRMMGQLEFLLKQRFDEQVASNDLKADSTLWVTDKFIEIALAHNCLDKFII